MGNLGGYEVITTAAKAAGGPENWVASIEKGASVLGRRTGRVEGVVFSAALALVLAGVYSWKKRADLRNDELQEEAALAKERLTEAINSASRGPGTEADGSGESEVSP